MTLPRVFLATLALLFVSRVLAEIGIGDTREAVLQQAGPPTSRAQRGNREILQYPHGARVELIDGKVTDVKGPLPVNPASASAAAVLPADQGAATPQPEPARTMPVNSQPVPPAPSPKTGSARAADATPNSATAADALGKKIESMDTAWGQRPQVPIAPAQINWPKLAVGILLHFAITLFALKIAFKIEEMDALWSGVFAIAGIDVGLYALLELLGPVTHGLTSMGALESGVGAIVMVFTIQKFCFTKKLQYAVVTAMSVKLIVRLCHMFVFVLLLNALFG